MAPKVVNIYRFEYEILPSMNQWNAYIAAFSPDEAAAHLSRTVNQPLRVTATTHVCRLDDISGEIRNNVIQAFLATQGQKNNDQNPVTPPAEEAADEKNKPVKEKPKFGRR